MRLNVMFRYRNNGSQPFSFPVLENKVRDTYIVDSANRTKYEVLHYQSSSPLSSTTQDLRTGSGATIEPGSILNMWAKFPAPPEETTQIGLYIPDAPPFDGLEISGQDAGTAAGGSATNTDIEAARIRTSDLGETRPIAHNTRPDGSDDPEGRQKNRRVAIVVQK